MIPSIRRYGALAAPDPMKAFSLHSRLALFALAVALVVASVAPVRAQDGAVVLQCAAGFGDMSPASSYNVYRHLGEWVPFRVRALNIGPAVKGTLVVLIENFNGRPTRYEKRVELPSGAQQTHEILARVVGTNKEPQVAFEVDGAPVAQIEVPLSKAAGEQLRLGVIDREATALNDISSVTIDPNDSRHPFGTVAPVAPVDPNAVNSPGYVQYGQPVKMPIAPLVFEAAAMPHHWIGYASLDAVVINDAPLSEVDEAQATALRTWIANGGMLIVAGGADFPGLRRAGLDALLPVDVLEKRTLPSLGGLTSTYSAFESNAGALVAVGTLRPSCQALLSVNENPLVAERRYGAGWVRFVAVDPKLVPYRGWVGTPTLWSDLVRPIVERSANRVVYNGFNGGDAKMNLLYDLADVRAPLVVFYFLYLLVYLFILGPLNYVVLRYKGRLEYSWITIPAAVVIFSLGTVVVARVMRGTNSVMVAVSVDHYFQREGVGFSRSSLLVVPSAKDEYRIGLKKDSASSPWIDFGGSTNDDFRFDQTEAAPAIVENLNTWDVKTFDVITAEAGEPPARVRFVSGGVEIANTSQDTLHSVVAITRDGVYSVGDLGPGANGSSHAPEVPSAPLVPWYASKLGDYADGKRLVEEIGPGKAGGWGTPGSAPADDLFAYANLTKATLASLDRPVLVAVREGKKTEATLESGAREQRLSFLIVYLEEGAQ